MWLTVLQCNRDWDRPDRLWRSFLFLGSYLLVRQGSFGIGKYPLLGRRYVNNWYEVNGTILYETKPLQGFNCLCRWIFCGSCWMARHWHDNGSLWLYCSLQWFLAHCFDFFAEDSCSWLVTPISIP